MKLMYKQNFYKSINGSSAYNFSKILPARDFTLMIIYVHHILQVWNQVQVWFSKNVHVTHTYKFIISPSAYDFTLIKPFESIAVEKSWMKVSSMTISTFWGSCTEFMILCCKFYLADHCMRLTKRTSKSRKVSQNITRNRISHVL